MCKIDVLKSKHQEKIKRITAKDKYGEKWWCLTGIHCSNLLIASCFLGLIGEVMLINIEVLLFSR